MNTRRARLNQNEPVSPLGPDQIYAPLKSKGNDDEDAMDGSSANS